MNIDRRLLYDEKFQTITAVVLVGIFTNLFFERLNMLRPVVYSQTDGEFQMLMYKLFSSSMTGGVLVVGLLGVILFTSLNNYKKWRGWEEYKVIVITCVVVLSWGFAFYEVNYYYDYYFVLDRSLLLVLAVISLINPYLSILFVLQAFLCAKHLSYPVISSYSFTDKQVLFQVIVVFWAMYSLKNTILKRISSWAFIVTVLAVISNWYFLAGIGKLQIGWVNRNNLYFLFASTVDFGWLSWVDRLVLVKMGRFMEENRNLIIYPTILIEFFVPLILFYNRRTIFIGLVSYILFHLIVFLTSGIFFWKWIVLEVAIIIWFLLKDREVFSKHSLLTYFIILISSYFFYNSNKLAWIDTGIYQKTEVYLVEPNGERQLLTNSFFKPYDLVIAQNRFNYMSYYKLLTNTFGSSENYIDEETKTIFRESQNKLSASVSDLPFLVEKSNEADSIRRDVLVDFFKNFIRNKVLSTKKVPGLITPFQHIYQSSTDELTTDKNLQKLSFELVSSKRVADSELEYTTVDSDTIRFTID